MQSGLCGRAALLNGVDANAFRTVFQLSIAQRRTLQRRGDQLRTGRGGGALIQRHFNVQRLTVTDQTQLHFGAGFGGRYPRAQLGKAAQRLVVEADDHIARFDTCFCRAGVRQHFTDKRPALYVDVERFGDIGAHLHTFNTQQPAFDFAELNELLRQGFGHIAGNRKTDPDAAATRGQNGCVDPNQLTVKVK